MSTPTCSERIYGYHYMHKPGREQNVAPQVAIKSIKKRSASVLDSFSDGSPPTMTGPSLQGSAPQSQLTAKSA